MFGLILVESHEIPNQTSSCSPVSWCVLRRVAGWVAGWVAGGCWDDEIDS